MPCARVVSAALPLASVVALTTVLAACAPTVGQGAERCESCDQMTCTPGVNLCAEGNLHACGTGGTVGERVQSCEAGCAGGTCTPERGQPPPNCAAGAGDAVFVVDFQHRLYSFDPTSTTFTTIGRMNCPAAGSPYSMSVDRAGSAWVLYDSGELFHVSTSDAACTEAAFPAPPQEYRVFGMGFVSDTANPEQDRLYVAGTLNRTEFDPTRLGVIDPVTLSLTDLADLGVLPVPPELTGTAEGRLVGYFPGVSSYIAELDRTTGAMVGPRWPAGSVDELSVAGWAFAHWGGHYYVFETTWVDPLVESTRSQVLRIDPEAAGGQGASTQVASANVPFIVGAGVSTCAPVVADID